MEVRVDPVLIRSEREKRAWSQEHLAEVAGLGLRTIQRIEATGAASYESTRALAAVLGIPVSALRVEPSGEPAAPAFETREIGPRLTRAWPRRAFAAAGAFLAVGLSVFIARSVSAEQIMLEVGVTLDDVDRRVSRLITEDGQDAEVRFDDQLRFTILPTIRDDGILLLSTRVYVFEDGDFVLVSEPRVAVRSDSVAEIAFGAEGGRRFRFRIKPTIR